MRSVWLGYLDSNQEQKNQNLPCCQLHHTPMGLAEAGPTVYFTVRFGSRHIEVESGVLRELEGLDTRRRRRYSTTGAVPSRSRLMMDATRAPLPAATMSCVGPGGVRSPIA